MMYKYLPCWLWFFSKPTPHRWNMVSMLSRLRCGVRRSLELQLVLAHHPPKNPPLSSRRTRATTLAYRDPRTPERPYSPLHGHDFPPRPQQPPAMLLHLLYLTPPEDHGRVFSIREAFVNSCRVFMNLSQHLWTRFLVKLLCPFLSVKQCFVYRTWIRHGTCAKETRLHRPYPNPGPKRRWFHHRIGPLLSRRRVMGGAQNVYRPPRRGKLYRKRS